MRAKGQLRIVSGYLSGQLVDTPKTGATQPMGERERIAIFNQIRSYLPGAKVLDAFAGSGALGITAISNGADSVDFLEKNPEAIKAISANLKKHKCDNVSHIIKNVDQLKSYDLIFADPPYGNPQYDLVIKIAKTLKPGGILVLSHPKTPQPPELDDLRLLSDRSYAAACIKIYQKAEQ